MEKASWQTARFSGKYWKIKTRNKLRAILAGRVALDKSGPLLKAMIEVARQFRLNLKGE